MAKYVSKETTIEEIARFLKARRSRKPVLFLGRRGGGLFGNTNLYGILKNFSLRQFDTLSDIGKFEECYKILSMHSSEGKKFSEGEVRQILNNALIPLKHRKEDEILSNLIKEGLFDTIITTNVDALLEEACEHQNMKQYNLIIHGRDDSKMISQGATQYHQVIKVFGDIKLSFNTVGTEFDLEADQVLKEFLRLKLAEEVLVIGYDPIWDQSIEQAFLEAGKAVWYINEELPSANMHLAHVLNQRKGKYLVGPQGSYKGFLRALNDLIGSSIHRGTGIIVPSPISLPQTHMRNKAFVSYSHENREYLKRLQTHVKGYRYVYGAEAILDCWDDTKIPKGANWKEEIEKALESAKVAVLLVSADFLASDFISEYEVPALLEAAQKGKLTILPIVVGPCPFDRTPLSPYQAINGVSNPLTSLPPHAQEEIWAEAAQKVCSILNLGE